MVTVTPLPSMPTAFKFRLYPFPDQERELLAQLGELTSLWNHALEERSSAWKRENRSVTYVGQCRSLTRWRGYDAGGLGRLNAQVAQECLARLNDAFGHFFRRCKLKKQGKWRGKLGYPQFKRETFSLTYPQADGSVSFTGGRNGTHRLHLSKVGDIPVEVHREPPTEHPKTCTVEREGERWYAVLTYEVPEPAPPSQAPPQNPIGVDLGLTHLAALSDGGFVEPPKFLRAAERRLRRAQRSVSRKKKGSRNRQKAKVRLAQCHQRVADQRRDFAHKLTTGWVQEHDLVAFEDMDLRPLAQGDNAKSVHDAGWGFLRQFSQYKEARRGGRYVEVPTAYTTQTCSECGTLADPPIGRHETVFRCPKGHREDRDLNAARNVLARALAIVPGGTGETTPVETGPPPHRARGRRVRAKKQEPPLSAGVAS